MRTDLPHGARITPRSRRRRPARLRQPPPSVGLARWRDACPAREGAVRDDHVDRGRGARPRSVSPSSLFVLAIRRLLSRQANVTETMLRRYDDRLAGFAQMLNDALATLQSSRQLATLELEDDPEPMVRALELARERTSADGAIALVTGGKGTPIVATVGLSESETNHIARMGFPDYRGARAIEVGFAGDLAAPEGEAPVRAGLVMPLLRRGRGAEPARRPDARRRRDASARRTSTASRRSSTEARPPISRALNLRDADVVPELDMLTDLLDRQSFPDVLEREILRARLAHYPLALLVIDVDRLTWLNARIGILAADGVLLELAQPPPVGDAPPRLRIPARRRPLRDRPAGLGGRRRVGAVRGDPRRTRGQSDRGRRRGLRVGRDRGARAAGRRRLVRRPGRGGARRGEARSPRIGRRLRLGRGSPEGQRHAPPDRRRERSSSRADAPGRRGRYSEA